MRACNGPFVVDIENFSVSKDCIGLYCGVDSVGGPLSEQDSEQRFNLQVLGEQRESMHPQ